MGRIEAELVSAVAAHMAPGDLQSDNAGVRRGSAVAAESGPEGKDQDLSGAILASMAARPAVERTATAALRHSNPRLCALLGIDASRPSTASIGDPTGGYCGGATAPALAPRIAQVERAAGGSGAAAAPLPARPAEPRVAVGARSGSTPKARDPATAIPSGLRMSKEPPRPAMRIEEGLIPAGTRFLEVGIYPDERMSDSVLRDIARLGLPVARDRSPGTTGAHAVLAGPFADRQAVVRAHDKLRRAGFVRLRPRR